MFSSVDPSQFYHICVLFICTVYSLGPLFGVTAVEQVELGAELDIFKAESLFYSSHVLGLSYRVCSAGTNRRASSSSLLLLLAPPSAAAAPPPPPPPPPAPAAADSDSDSAAAITPPT